MITPNARPSSRAFLLGLAPRVCPNQATAEDKHDPQIFHRPGRLLRAHFGNAASRGKYKIVRPLPVENDNRLAYRIKSIAETFERIAKNTN